MKTTKAVNEIFHCETPENILETIQRKGKLVSTYTEGVNKKETYFYVNRDYTFHFFKKLVTQITFSDI